MRRRIRLSFVVLTTIAVAALFIPAALTARSRDLADQEVEIQRDVAVVGSGLPVVDTSSGVLDTGDEHRFALYTADGTRVAGDGPDVAEPSVLAAFEGDLTLAEVDGELVVGLLIRSADADGPFVLRGSESRQEADDATRRTIFRFGLVALAVIAAAIAAAALLSRRLARPVEALRGLATRLDDGAAEPAGPPSGITEIDEVAAALSRTGARVRSTLERERAFSAEASHQLRTPLAAMRAAVETEQLDPRPVPSPILEEVLGQIDHLETTVVGLLDLARDTHQLREPVDLRRAAEAASERWSAAFAEQRRTLVLDTTGGASRPLVAEAAVGQVLDVLVDNALRHGVGQVRIGIADVAGGVVLSVGDMGRIEGDTSWLFERRASSSAGGTGIGLALARTLVEAEGGRLRLSRPSPTTFQVTFPIA